MKKVRCFSIFSEMLTYFLWYLGVNQLLLHC